MLELAIRDKVAVSKRGDVIPAVERVVEKNEEGNTTWEIPAACPSCSTGLILRGAHHFCPNREECPAQVWGRLFFFAGTGQMDIENLGPETIQTLIDQDLVHSIPDLYTIEYKRLIELPGFGEKKTILIEAGLEKSKERPYQQVLYSLGIPELGPKVSELLIQAGYTDIDSLFELADTRDIQSLTAIQGIGEKTAVTIIDELSKDELRKEIAVLRNLGLKFSQEKSEGYEEEFPPIFAGQTWCVTGSFLFFSPRSKAMDEVRKRGGRVVTSVTGNTTHLLAGDNPGSKLLKAQEVGAEIISEEYFIDLLKKSGWRINGEA
jgi:DNA ligase (NAD+)